MSFFTGCSSFVINGGDFSININAPSAGGILSRLLGKRKDSETIELGADEPRKRRRGSSRNSDGLLVMNRDEFDLRTELVSGSNYRIHSASHGGRAVAVKVFEGSHAKQDWIMDVAFSKKFLHSNVPKVVGVSDQASESPFVVFHGISEKRMQSLLAKALRTDLGRSVHLSMKIAKGLAAGLSYMKSQKVPLSSGITTNNRNWESFDIFAGENEEPIIAIHPSSTTSEDTSISLENYDNGVEALNGLCQKIFTETNSILYDDSPERERDSYNSKDLSRTNATQNDSERALNLPDMEAITKSLEKTKPSRIPRREVWWQPDTGASNRSLESIARRFEDYLDSSSSDYPLRHIQASKYANYRRTSHQCAGYLREEILLTLEVSRSAIVSHEYPSQRELCSVCGELVLPTETDALAYLDALEAQALDLDQPHIYNQFIDTMKDFKSGQIDTLGVMRRTSYLFKDHPLLLQNFNIFLPVGYGFECSVDTGLSTMIIPKSSTPQTTNADPKRSSTAPAASTARHEFTSGYGNIGEPLPIASPDPRTTDGTARSLTLRSSMSKKPSKGRTSSPPASSKRSSRATTSNRKPSTRKRPLSKSTKH